MNTKTIPSDRDLLLSEDEHAGSHALSDSFCTKSDLTGGGKSEEYFQSSPVSASGSAWTLAILGVMGGTSDSVTPLRVLGTGARQYISSEGSSQRQRARRAIALLDQWLFDDSGYDEETWPDLKEALEENRLSSRRLFDA